MNSPESGAPSRWSSVLGGGFLSPSPAASSTSSVLPFPDPQVAQSIRLKKWNGWEESEISHVSSFREFSVLVRFRPRSSPKPVIPLKEYERKQLWRGEGMGDRRERAKAVKREESGGEAMGESTAANDTSQSVKIEEPDEQPGEAVP